MTDRATVDTLKREFQEALFGALGRFPAGATRNDLYIALSLVARWRVMHRWVATSETYFEKASRTVVLPLGGVPARAPPRQQPGEPRDLRDEARQALAELGYDLDATPRAGGGARARQRRPRPAGRLLHGLARHARDPRHRLRHPLRVRHLRPGDPRRLAGRDDRQVAAPRQPLGDPPRRRSPSRVGFGGRTEAGHRRARPLPRALDARSSVVRGVAYDTPILGYRVGTRRTCCASGRPRPPSRSTSRPSTSATTTAPSTRRSSPRTSPRCSTRTTSSCRASSCASSSSTSSSPARCRT